MKKNLLIVSLVLLGSGCAQQTWHKNNATSEDFEMDKGTCQAQAFSVPNAPAVQVALVYNSCMRGRGWYLSRD